MHDTRTTPWSFDLAVFDLAQHLCSIRVVFGLFWVVGIFSIHATPNDVAANVGPVCLGSARINLAVPRRMEQCLGPVRVVGVVWFVSGGTARGQMG